MYPAYVMMLSGMVLLVVFRAAVEWHKPPLALIVAGAAVLLNWIANSSYVEATGDTDPELFFLATDAMSLAAIALVKDGLPGQLLVQTYAGQIIAHLIRAAGAVEPYYYWQLLTMLGYAQILIISIWAIAPAYRDAGHGTG